MSATSPSVQSWHTKERGFDRQLPGEERVPGARRVLGLRPERGHGPRELGGCRAGHLQGQGFIPRLLRAGR